MLDARLLEIPQSSEATIRLLKARIRSLEEQLGVALKLNQGACVVWCASDCMMLQPTCESGETATLKDCCRC
jgi:hypothetical protein